MSNEITDLEYAGLNQKCKWLNIMPKVIYKDILSFLEDEGLKGNPVARISFTLSKYNIFQRLPVVELVHFRSGGLVKRVGFCINLVYSFLSFDLSHSIRSEIAKVKPVLASGNIHVFNDTSGIIKLSESMGGQELSVKSFDYFRHSLILGQSGSGKSYLMKLLIEDLSQKVGNEYGVVLIDPHASLEPLLKQIPSKLSINFKDVQTNLFVNVGQPVLSSELATDLFSTVLDIKSNQDLQRVLKFGLRLLFSINQMNFPNLKDLLTDSIKRKEILRLTEDRSLLQFFETEYPQIYTTKYDTAVLPVINLLSEMDFINPAAQAIDLAESINNHFLVSVPVKQTDLGKNITKIVGGAMIQQVFTLMQAGLIQKKVILMVDEFSVVQNPSLSHILSEARKFGLTVIFTQQYLMQVPLEMLQSIFANVVNYFCFKVARDDAEVLARNLNFEIDEYFMKNKNDPREIQEMGVKILTDLNPREVVCRIMANDRFVNPFKSKTRDGIV